MEEVVPVGGNDDYVKKNAHNALEGHLVDVVYIFHGTVEWRYWNGFR